MAQTETDASMAQTETDASMAQTETDASENTPKNRAITAYRSARPDARAPEIQTTLTVAGGQLLTIRAYTNSTRTYSWYFENRDSKQLLFTAEEVATYIASLSTSNPFTQYVQKTSFPEVVKLLVVSGLAVLFSLAVIVLVIFCPTNQALQVLTGLAGLTIGYFVGKEDTPRAT